MSQALKGSSALRAQTARTLDIELATAEGKLVLTWLWNYIEFFDSTRASRLIPKLMGRDYPQHLTALGLTMRCAPRIFSIGRSMPKPVVNCGNSILACCLQSVSMVGGFLYDHIEMIMNTVPFAVCEEYVDDLMVTMFADSEGDLKEAALDVGRVMKNGSDALDFKVADKAAIVPETSHVARSVVKILCGEGFLVKTQRIGKDLGVSTAAGHRRAVAERAKTLKKGNTRGKKVRTLVKRKAKAICLILTGVVPQQSYEHHVPGAAMTTVAQCRNNLKNAANIPRAASVTAAIQ